MLYSTILTLITSQRQELEVAPTNNPKEQEMTDAVIPKGGLRTELEETVPPRLMEAFQSSAVDFEVRLDEFPRYVRRQKMTRLLSLYELFKLVLPVKGSIIECGVHHGFGLAAWHHFSSILEPNNLNRRIYGFDTFEGFTGITEKDAGARYKPREGDLFAASKEELENLFAIHDDNRFLGHIPKVKLVQGDIRQSAPAFLDENQHLLVSLLFLDLDLYEPTKVALDTFAPRVPRGGVIAFDELDNPIWPGETSAMLEYFQEKKLEIRRFEFDPYIGYALVS